jgi:Transcriptional activator TraM
MTDKMNEAIKDIAFRHGVVLGKDDPVLILQTMNEKLLAENRKEQEAMLAQLKEEMENISSQWKDDAKDKAERVLNAALASSKETMDKILRQATHESALVMQKMISDSLKEARVLNQQTQKTSQFTLLSSAVLLTVSCTFILFFLSKIVS